MQDYTLLWDTQLTSIRPHEPMDYIPEHEPVKVDEVMSKDVRAVRRSSLPTPRRALTNKLAVSHVLVRI